MRTRACIPTHDRLQPDCNTAATRLQHDCNTTATPPSAPEAASCTRAIDCNPTATPDRNKAAARTATRLQPGCNPAATPDCNTRLQQGRDGRRQHPGLPCLVTMVTATRLQHDCNPTATPGRYGRLQHPGLPCLVTMAPDQVTPLFFPLEVCKVTMTSLFFPLELTLTPWSP